MKSMNDMTMKELLEADRKINQHFFEEAHFLRKLKETEEPPDWAYEMDKDIEHQKATGAVELEVQCAYCGKWCKATGNFCSAKCHEDYTELKKTEAERKKTRKLL